MFHDLTWSRVVPMCACLMCDSVAASGCSKTLLPALLALLVWDEVSDALQVPTWHHQMTALRLRASARALGVAGRHPGHGRHAVAKIRTRSSAGPCSPAVSRRDGPAARVGCLANFPAGILTRVEMCRRTSQCSGTSSCGGETPSAMINRLEIDAGGLGEDFAGEAVSPLLLPFCGGHCRAQSGLLPHRSSQLSGFRGEGYTLWVNSPTLRMSWILAVPDSRATTGVIQPRDPIWLTFERPRGGTDCHMAVQQTQAPELPNVMPQGWTSSCVLPAGAVGGSYDIVKSDTEGREQSGHSTKHSLRQTSFLS